MITESMRLGRAMFTLSFCFAYKSQSHNILFSTASCVTQGPRLVDGVVIWHHKTLLQRAVLHSLYLLPNQTLSDLVEKGSLFFFFPTLQPNGDMWNCGQFYGPDDPLKGVLATYPEVQKQFFVLHVRERGTVSQMFHRCLRERDC